MSAKRSTLVTEASSARAAVTMPAPSAPAHTRSIARPVGQMFMLCNIQSASILTLKVNVYALLL